MPRRELVRQRLRGFTFSMLRSSMGSPVSAKAPAGSRPGLVTSPMLSIARLLHAVRTSLAVVVGLAALRVGSFRSYACGWAFQDRGCVFHCSKLYPNSFAGRKV